MRSWKHAALGISAISLLKGLVSNNSRFGGMRLKIQTNLQTETRLAG